MANSDVKVALIEGFHPFDVINFQKMFREIDGIDFYPQVIENWAVDWGACRKDYDVLVFYNMNMELGPPFGEAVEAAINEMGEVEQGIFMLHHAILSLPQNDALNQIVGIPDRSFDFHVDQDYTMQSADDDHPISQGLRAWDMHDETYTMAEPGDDSRVLFTVDHPKSMKPLGWTRQHKKSRVFNFQPGHDNAAWANPKFREVVARGIQWCAGNL